MLFKIQSFTGQIFELEPKISAARYFNVGKGLIQSVITIIYLPNLQLE